MSGRSASIAALVLASCAYLEIGSAAAGASLATTPIYLNPTPFTEADYPPESFERSEAGIVSIELRISALGKVEACTVTETSHYHRLDKQTCNLMGRRAKIAPAVDEHGSAVAGRYRMSAFWWINGKGPSTNASLELQVSLLPAEYLQPLKVRVAFGPTGHADHCDAIATSGSAVFDKVACRYIVEKYFIPLPQSGSDEVTATAIRYISVAALLKP